MSNSICQFMPTKNYSGDIKPVHFVYETDFHTLRQPFFYSISHLHLITKGSAVLKLNSKEFALKKGDIFFILPAYLHEIEASEDFEYLYISFMGSGTQALFDELGISMSAPVYHNFDHLIDFWHSAIRRINSKNITVLTEGVLLYTLSFINNPSAKDASKEVTDNLFEKVIDYIDNHYRDIDMSLAKLASNFSYTEKYLSSLFKKHMNISFRSYLNRLRIQYSYQLIDRGENSVMHIASQCGYSDPLYFSKLFKQQRGITPSEYIKNKDI